MTLKYCLGRIGEMKLAVSNKNKNIKAVQYMKLPSSRIWKRKMFVILPYK